MKSVLKKKGIQLDQEIKNIFLENSKYWEFKDSDVEYFRFIRSNVKKMYIILTDSSSDQFGIIGIPISKIERFTTTTSWYKVDLEEKSPWKSGKFKITLVSE